MVQNTPLPLLAGGNPHRANPRGNKRILIIEDEPDQIMMMEIRLRASGFDVITALDGSEGLRKALDDRPDLILLDIILPGMDGFEVCERLKGLPETRNIPVLALTASGSRDVLPRCMDAGADDGMRKPCETDDLLDRINALLKKGNHSH